MQTTTTFATLRRSARQLAVAATLGMAAVGAQAQAQAQTQTQTQKQKQTPAPKQNTATQARKHTLYLHPRKFRINSLKHPSLAHPNQAIQVSAAITVSFSPGYCRLQSIFNARELLAADSFFVQEKARK